MTESGDPDLVEVSFVMSKAVVERVRDFADKTGMPDWLIVPAMLDLALRHYNDAQLASAVRDLVAEYQARGWIK